jgi:malonyl CoA-acyl carrier protein transacylase
LQAIADQADGMGAEIAKSVRNVRALTAELRLSSEEGAKKYAEAMEAMQGASPEGLQKLLDEFRTQTPNASPRKSTPSRSA